MHKLFLTLAVFLLVNLGAGMWRVTRALAQIEGDVCEGVLVTALDNGRAQ